MASTSPISRYKPDAALWLTEVWVGLMPMRSIAEVPTAIDRGALALAVAALGKRDAAHSDLLHLLDTGLVRREGGSLTLREWPLYRKLVAMVGGELPSSGLVACRCCARIYRLKRSDRCPACSKSGPLSRYRQGACRECRGGFTAERRRGGRVLCANCAHPAMRVRRHRGANAPPLRRFRFAIRKAGVAGFVITVHRGNGHAVTLGQAVTLDTRQNVVETCDAEAARALAEHPALTPLDA